MLRSTLDRSHNNLNPRESLSGEREIRAGIEANGKEQAEKGKWDI